jgi:hypothetical protein
MYPEVQGRILLKQTVRDAYVCVFVQKYLSADCNVISV